MEVVLSEHQCDPEGIKKGLSWECRRIIIPLD